MSDKKKTLSPACADCGQPGFQRLCMTQDGGAGKFCPTAGDQEMLAQANAEYDDPDTHKFARQASIQEAECYANRHQRPYVMQPTKTRIVEICEFAERMGYKRLGLAFCIGLAAEAELVAEVFRAHDFEVVSAACKAGRSSKEALLGLGEEHKIYQGTEEAACNPIYQAKLLEAGGAEFNVLLGLCVGHDSLFFKHAEAPTTVLAVKDRVTGHNPMAALYTSATYYKKITQPDL